MDLNILSDKLKELKSSRPLSKIQIDEINREKRIEHVWTSIVLEGASIQKYQVESILEIGYTLNECYVKDILETLDLANAFDYMEELVLCKKSITQDIIRELNKLVTIKTSDHIEYAGEYRLNEAYPYGVEGVIYTRPSLIFQEMGNLVWWIEEIGPSLHPVHFAAELHQRFVSIHPFVDGNGRTARLLMEFALTSNGYPITNIQPSKEKRLEYMETLAQSQRSGNVQPFVDLVARYVDEELDFRINLLKLNEENNKKLEEIRNK